MYFYFELFFFEFCFFFFFPFWCLYLTDAMAFRRLEWHVRADEATIAF